jgi:hypothetical protein
MENIYAPPHHSPSAFPPRRKKLSLLQNAAHFTAGSKQSRNCSIIVRHIATASVDFKRFRLQYLPPRTALKIILGRHHVPLGPL